MTLEIGIALGGHDNAASWRRALRTVEFADHLGLHSVWLPESHFRTDATASPLVALSAFVSCTERLQLATTSILLPIHHPLRVAAEVTTLDILSGGRTIVGLGRGFQAPMFEGFGIARLTKRDRFDEALDTILAAWSGEPFQLKGSYYASLDERQVRVALRPIQQPHPPLVVAAFGRKGLLQAARRGLPYLASPLEGLSILQENYEIWREQIATGLDKNRPQIPVMRTAFISEDNSKCEVVREALKRDALRVKRRTPAAVARAAEGAIDERVVVGNVNQVCETLARYRDVLGMDLLIVRAHPPAASQKDCERSLEHFAQDVGPIL